MRTIRWSYKGRPYVSQVERRCSKCGKLAVIALPPAILAEQPDDTTHVCHPLAGGCNHGFALDTVLKEIVVSDAQSNRPASEGSEGRHPQGAGAPSGRPAGSSSPVGLAARVEIIDLCGASVLCTERSACSFILRGRRTHFCRKCLDHVAREAQLSLKQVEGKLPGFRWEKGAES